MPIEVRVIDMHTNGEPFRILLDSSPRIEFLKNSNIVEKRRYMRDNFDIIRKISMREPRGHANMYGCIVTNADPVGDDINFAVIFMHHSDYSLMCGHGTMALARFAVDRELVPKTEPEARVGIQCPCGVVEAFATVSDGTSTGHVRFVSPTGYLFSQDLKVTFRDKSVTFDIAYGGTFYAIIAANEIGLNLDCDRAEKVVKVGMEFKRCVAEAHKIVINEPDVPRDYLFLYGLIIVDDRTPRSIGDELRHVIIFAEGQIDRSPCGSGTTARLAALATRGLLPPKQEVAFRNPVLGNGSVFYGMVLETCLKEVMMGTCSFGVENGVRCQIRGKTFYSGESKFRVEDTDVFPEGFELR